MTTQIKDDYQVFIFLTKTSDQLYLIQKLIKQKSMIKHMKLKIYFFELFDFFLKKNRY